MHTLKIVDGNLIDRYMLMSCVQPAINPAVAKHHH